MLNIKLIAVLMALLFIAGVITLATGHYVIAFLCIIGLGLLSSHIKKNEKYYDSELDDMFPEDKEKLN